MYVPIISWPPAAWTTTSLRYGLNDKSNAQNNEESQCYLHFSRGTLTLNVRMISDSAFILVFRRINKRICLSFKWSVDVITDGRKPQVTFLWLYISLKKALKRGLVSRYVWKKTIQTVLYTMNFHYKTYEMRSATYCGTNQNVKYIFNCSLCSLLVFANSN